MNGAPTNLSAVKLALMAQEARAQAQAFINADPIAIVGMACRAPGGVDTPDALWRLVCGRVDATREVPAERWNASLWFDADLSARGKITTKRAGFLEQIDAFDPDYFGILLREAELMDPQQRLALETAIEAVDDAGVPHERLKGSRTGVFIASYHDDYARLVYEDIDAIELRTLTGTLQSIVSNRISHFLDLCGPSFTLDSACSTSLVAVHLACQSLRAGESDFALAGGVSVMLSPELMVAMSKVGFMSPDGRCKSFDARADGFGRGEGCGIVALKRLSDAIASGDRVIAVIRGSAMNQDGRSTVLTAPNGVAQERLIREALSNAAVAPERVVYIEAHGTGTALGDPIEVDALGAALTAPGAKSLLSRVYQSQYRPSRGCRWRHRLDQSRARLASWRDPAAGLLRQTEPASATGRHASENRRRPQGVAGVARLRRREFVWGGRHERSCRAGTGA